MDFHDKQLSVTMICVPAPSPESITSETVRERLSQPNFPTSILLCLCLLEPEE